MLTFLTGTYFSAKKQYIYEKIRCLLETGETVYLIVPEQASFDRGRDFLFTFKEKAANKLCVTSFTHLSRDVLENEGFKGESFFDEAAKNVFMSIAAEECKDSLDIYKKHSGRLSLIKMLLGEYSEIYTAGLSTDELWNVSKKLPDGSLKRKTKELASVFSAYEAISENGFTDSSRGISEMTKFLSENNVFKNAYVFFDDFRGFTGSQIKLMEEIISQSKECFVSVFAPDTVMDFGSPAFSHAISNCRLLKQASSKRGIKFKEEKITLQNPIKPFEALSSSLFCAEKEIFEKESPEVCIISANNKYSECDTAALEIKKLLEKGMRCRDISISDRNGDYAKILTSALKKYNIPVFEDKRVPLYEYPLIKMILSAVSLCTYGFSTEEIFAYIKTELTGISSEECSNLENYVYIWQIDKNDWTRPFTNHPEGFGVPETDESKKLLLSLNEIREKIISPLLKLKKKLQKENGETSCKAVFEFATEINAAENFSEYAKFLYSQNNEAAAVECAAVWDAFTSSLSSLYDAIKDKTLSCVRFYELLKIILYSGDIGRIPAGIDEIVIGTLGRTRHLEPKAVFILGCNDGIFPSSPATHGLFSSTEKRLLCENSFSLENIPENNYKEERMIAFFGLMNAKEKLFLSYSRTGKSGEKAEPSEIITEVKEILPKCAFIDDRNLSALDLIGSSATAFEQCTCHFNDNTPLSQSLKQFAKESDFKDRFNSLDSLILGTVQNIDDKTTAKELFKENMYISASKAEVFYTCAFKYFCQYGMNIKKQRPASLDARITGLLIHHILEHVFILKTNKELSCLSDEMLKKMIDTLTENYINEYMGTRENMSAILNRNLDKTKNQAFLILKRMMLEFSQSRFVTKDTELKISYDGDIPPYRLSLDDGASITVGGAVDRVDVMDEDEKSYLRIIDYKTGGKDFDLSEVFSGINMQMLIYLMCIWENGKERYGNVVPAGILYLPANTSGDMLKRNATEDEILAQRLKNGRMNGLILDNDSVLDGMEIGAKGKFIDAYIDTKGNKKGKFLSLKDFNILHGKIDEILKEMGLSLHDGKIPAIPFIRDSKDLTCEYCDYKDICRRTDEDEIRSPLGLSHAQAVEYLERGNFGE